MLHAFRLWRARSKLRASSAERDEAAAMLGRARDARAVPQLIEILAWAPNRHIARALGEIGDARALPVLLRHLSRRAAWDQQYVHDAVDAVAKLGQPSAIGPLSAFLHDCPEFAGVILSALDRLGPDARTDASRQHVERLIDVRTRHEERPRLLQTLDLLGWTPQSDTERAFAAVTRGDWDAAAAAGSEGIDLLAKAITGYPNEAERPANDAKIRALRTVRDPRAVPALVANLSIQWLTAPITDALVAIGCVAPDVVIEGLKAESPTAREANATALRAMEWEPRTAAERAFYAAALRDWKALEGIGMEALNATRLAFRTLAEPPERKRAGDTLVRLGDIQTLFYALRSGPHELRVCAAQCLSNQSDALDATADKVLICVALEAWPKIPAFGSDATEPLIQALSWLTPAWNMVDEVASLRIGIARALIAIGDARGVTAVRKLADHDDCAESRVVGHRSGPQFSDPDALEIRESVYPVRDAAKTLLNELRH